MSTKTICCIFGLFPLLSGLCSQIEIGGVTWTYTMSAGEVRIGTGYQNWHLAVPDSTIGEIVIPDEINGCRVTEIGPGAFQGCRKITKVIIPEGVRSIGESCFEYCIGLSSIQIPSSVTRIDDYAFRYCSSIEEITLPEGVSCINSELFSRCEKLTTVSLPKTITAIKFRAFSECRSLLTLEIPSGVIEIGEGAFRECSSLQSVKIPTCPTNISGGLFSGCTNLESVELPQGLSVIPDGMFWGCSSLTEIQIPESVTELGTACFSCTGLRSVNLGVNVRLIGGSEEGVDPRRAGHGEKYGAFQECKSLTAVTGGSGLVEIGGSAFFNCTSLEDVPRFPKLKKIGAYAFYGCEELQSFDYPEGLNAIDYAAFQYCKSLRVVALPVTLENILWGAFDYSGVESLEYNHPGKVGGGAHSNMDGLTSYYYDPVFNLPNIKELKIGVKPGSQIFDIGARVFSRMALTNVVVGSAVRHIGAGAFENCTELKRIVIPDSVQTLGFHAFAGCEALQSVEIGSGVRRIDVGVFCRCPALSSIAVSKSNETFYVQNGFLVDAYIQEIVAYAQGVSQQVDIPDQIERIKSESFSGCDSITRVYMRDSHVNYIGRKAFSGCDALSDVLLSERVRHVGAEAFPSLAACVKEDSGLRHIDGWMLGYSDKRATSIYVPDWICGLADDCLQLPERIQQVSGAEGVKYVGDCGLKYTEWYQDLPNGIHCLGSSVFGYKGSDAVVVVPSGVTQVAPYAFENCTSLTSVALPNTIVDIGNSAFLGCRSLQSVALPISLKTIGDHAFEGCPSLTNLDMPEGLVSIGKQSLPLSLIELIIPNTVRLLGWDLFNIGKLMRNGSYTANVKKLVVGDGVRDFVGYDADGRDLCDPEIPDAFTPYLTYGSGFDSVFASELEECVLGRGLRDIPNCFFIHRKPVGSKLAKVEFRLPSRIDRLGEHAFWSAALTDICIPEGVREIAQGAFVGCDGLKKVVLPGSLEMISETAFAGCEGISEIHLHKDLGWWCANAPILQDSAYDLYVDGEKVEEVSWPSDVRRIGEYGLGGCVSVNTVFIPDEVETIGSYAFCNCTNLELVVIGRGVTNIGAHAFVVYGSSAKLLSVVYLGNAPHVDPNPARRDSQGNPMPAIYSKAISYASEDSTGWREGGGIPSYWSGAEMRSYTPPWRFCTLAYDFGDHMEYEQTMVGAKIGSLPRGDRAGYYLEGWENVGSDGGMVSMGMTVNGDMNLRAKWIPNDYWILFNPWGGSGSMSPQRMKYDQSKALSPCAFTRDGYVFLGWATAYNRPAVYADCECVSNLTLLGEITLYAVWGLDLIPSLPVTASPNEIRMALEGSTDANLQANITDVATYNKYRAWAMKIGAAEVKASPNAWVSFAVDSAALLMKMPTDDDLKVEELKPSAMAGSFDFTVGVKDVTIGDKASVDNLKKLFGLEGAESLDAAAFSSENVSLDFREPQDGKLKFTATPAVDDAKSFFMKVKVK